MSKTTTPVTPAVWKWVLDYGVRPHPVLDRLREETARHPRSNMQIAPDQGQFMQVLVKLMNAHRCLEVGTFTGYSALAVALALPDDGKLVACDVSEEYTSVARRYWKEAGVESKIDLRLGPASQTLDTLLAEGGAGTFDFAFIDADKTGYDGYYEQCLKLLRPGGAVAFDNMLWDGRVADPADEEESTVALRALSARLRHDERVDVALLTIADGLTIARKR